MAKPSIVEEQEVLFNSSPCALYYVQSPSSASHANSQPSESAFLSPYAHETFSNNRSHEEASRLTLSRYSSSRGSNNSFLHEKKVTYDVESQEGRMKRGERQRLRIIGVNEEGHDDREGGTGRRNGIWRLVSLDPSSSFCCVAFQVIWRLMVSVCVALFVFFLATKPPEPKVSFKVESIRQFSLREGLDSTGVLTNILTCNCSLDIEIDNYSKVFGLHINPSTLEITFGFLNFASSEGDPYYVQSGTSSKLTLYVGTKNKPMYGAGRTMQDMIESGRGLPLIIWVRSRSTYKVVWNLVRSSYQHHAECRIVLNGAYDEQHHTEVYNSTCSMTTTHA